MNIKELRKLSKEELNKLVIDTRLKQLSMRVRKTSGAFTKTHEFSIARKLIAQIKTLLTQMGE